jgi:outer membrane protein insertion porin family
VLVRGSWTPVWRLTRRVRFATRFDFGYSLPLGEAVEVLPNRRFFAGGFNTHRGYTRRRLGPYDSANQPIGGEVIALASGELRFPIKGMFEGDLFIDSGHVWLKPGDVVLADLAVAIGAGVMLNTVVGPIHFDVAYNLTELPPDNSETVFQFGIGHPY